MVKAFIAYAAYFPIAEKIANNHKNERAQFNTDSQSPNRPNIGSLFIHEQSMLMIIVWRYRVKCCFSDKVPIDMKLLFPLFVFRLFGISWWSLFDKLIYKNIKFSYIDVEQRARK